MKTYYNLIQKLGPKLESLERNNEDILFITQQGIKFCNDTLEKLRTFVINNDFNSEDDEIEFFKKIKPHIVSKLIYYIKRLDIESKRPKAGIKEQLEYLKFYIAEFQSYFNYNLEIYHYFKSNAHHFDQQYFLIKNKTIRLNLEPYYFYTDTQFSTSHDSTFAIILAHTNLIEYLKNEIMILENNNTETIRKPNLIESKLNWTGSKTDLVELIYALYSSGAINSGTADIKELAIAFQNIFNIELGEYYRTYLEIRYRKINQTKFLDQIKDSLLQHMEESDQ